MGDGNDGVQGFPFLPTSYSPPSSG